MSNVHVQVGNPSLLKQHLNSTVDISTWEEVCTFLQSLPFTPPPFRRSMFYSISKATKNSVSSCLLDLLSSFVEAHERSPDKEADPSQFTTTPIFKLWDMFEALILHPKSHTETGNNNSIVKRRLERFQRGDIINMYTEVLCLAHSSPNNRRKTKNNNLALIKRATSMMKKGNYAKALQCLQPSPVVANTQDNIQDIKSTYFPDPCPSPLSGVDHLPSPTSDKALHFLLQNEWSIKESLKRLKTGTASGPMADSIDLIRHTALLHELKLTSLEASIKILANGDIPPEAKAWWDPTFFTALEKKCGGKRPLGVGGSSRRATAGHIARVSSPFLAQTMAPLQFAIGFSSGIEMITETVKRLSEKYMVRSISQLQAKDHPTRCLLLLDLTNMFNACSRVKVRQILQKCFPSLLPYFDATYSGSNKCWFETPEGIWDYILQHEGFPQGDPLSPIFASLCLWSLQVDLQRKLDESALLRLQNGDPSDDGKGGTSSSFGYIDDSTILPVFDDIPTIFQHYIIEGPSHGCFLSKSKCQIVTNFTGESPLPFISKSHASSISRYIDQFGSKHGELTKGAVLLGHPLGHIDIARHHFTSTFSKIAHIMSLLTHEAFDPHFSMRLLQFCIHSKFHHLLSEDMDLQFSTTGKHFYSHQSDLTNLIRETTTNILCNASGNSTIPAHSMAISEQSVNEGGLGMFNPSIMALPLYICPIIQCIRTATKGTVTISPSQWKILEQEEARSGIKLIEEQPTIKLGPVFEEVWSNWESDSSNTGFVEAVRIYTTNFTGNPKDQDPVQYFVEKSYFRSTSKLINHERSVSSFRTQQTIFPDHVKRILPSLTTPVTSFCFTRTPTTHAQYNFSPPQLRIALCRKLCMPILPIDANYKCPKCNSTIDAEGNHFFECSHYSKDSLHNHLRDNLLAVFSTLAAVAKISTTPECTGIEPRRIIRERPDIKPADIAIHTNANVDVPLICIDITTAQARPPKLSQKDMLSLKSPPSPSSDTSDDIESLASIRGKNFQDSSPPPHQTSKKRGNINLMNLFHPTK